MSMSLNTNQVLTPSSSASSSSPQQQQQHRTHRAKCYLIISNISKKPNVKSLLLLAAAFGCTKVFVAGQKKFNFDPDENNDGMQQKKSDVPHQLRNHIKSENMEIIKFDRLEECIAHIKSIGTNDISTGDGPAIHTSNRPIRIIGVEIDESAIDLEEEPFDADTAFMMGNEGQGMNEKQMSLCDGFVRIAQYGGGTASLNVSVAASIVLHSFHHWARGDEHVRRYCDA